MILSNDNIRPTINLPVARPRYNVSYLLLLLPLVQHWEVDAVSGCASVTNNWPCA